MFVNKKYIYISVAVAVVVIGGILWLTLAPLGGLPQSGILGGGSNMGGTTQGGTTSGNGQPAPEKYVPKDGVISQVMEPVEKQANQVIDITSVGFSPADINIKIGQSVIWTNRDKGQHWVIVSSANPYPEKGSCGSSFNSCRGLKLGENFRQTFGVPGRWAYYDKLNPNFTGTVLVN